MNDHDVIAIDRARAAYPNFKAVATTLRTVKSATLNDWGALCWYDGAFHEAAHRPNLEVLDRMIARRHELARVLGYRSWADYALADKMTGSAAEASAFIDRVVAASGEAAEREYQTLLRRKRQDRPAAAGIDRWEVAYLRELRRR